MIGYRRTLVCTGFGLLVGVLLFAFRPSVGALPEYATRTSEPCATCHANPAGGGLLTTRGKLWVAEGKPDKVPQSDSEAASPAPAEGSPASDGTAVYQRLGCAGCHGTEGEGTAGPALNQGDLKADEVGRIAREGIGSMPGYGTDVLTDADLTALVLYVQGLAPSERSGQNGDRPEGRQPASAACAEAADADDGSLLLCDGN